MKYLIYTLLASTFLFACVPAKKFQESQALADKYLAEKLDCQEKLKTADLSNEELVAAERVLGIKVANLIDDTTRLSILNAQLSKSLADMKNANSNLSSQQQEIIASSSAMQDELIKELARKQKELEDKEKELAILSKSLNDKEATLNTLQADLAGKGKRITDLEANLAAKDAALKELKTKISDALKSFTSEELTVVEKDGKVYVSLSENLLFTSGSFTVDKKGAEAISKLAEVLKKQENVDIIVEGHTDNVPYNGSGQLKDNWDLSVKRATSVVRILTQSGLSTDNLSACGRGDSKPVASNETTDGKAKNRRTEIILSPQLTKLFEIIEGK